MQHWNRLDSQQQYKLVVVTAGAGVLAFSASAYLLRRAARRRRNAFYASTDDEDDIDFADPANDRFERLVRNYVETHVRPLTEMTEQLALLGAEMEEVTAVCAAPETTEQLSIAMARRTRLKELIQQSALQADELLTQYMVRLDGLPTSGNVELKKRRRELIQNAHQYADRIAPFLHPAYSAMTPHGGEEEEGEAAESAEPAW